MAIAYKVLGQVAPAATTNTTVYTVPAATSAVVSTIAVCNRGVSGSYRIAVVPSGDTLGNKHYVVYDAYVNQYDSALFTLGVTLATGDQIVVYASTANFSFSVFGSEIS